MNWKSTNHANREGRVPNRYRGYRVNDDHGERSALRATPLLVAQRDDFWAAITMPWFWQNFPKAIEADSDSLTLALWPRQYADLHELQGGEQKTHVFYLAAGRGAPDWGQLEWCRQPSTVRLDPSWCSSTEAVPYLVPAAQDPNTDYLNLVSAAIEGPESFERKREVVDEYGWRHFGDLYADHEAVYHQGASPLVSHYNNQYDAVAGFAYHFMRTGDARWWRAMDELAAHVVDIDIYHTDRDKSSYNGGMFWHTCHYTDAGRSTHRSYPRASSCQGGGPGNEHNYSTGLMLHYFLTGNRLSRDAVLGLARWVANMEDGRKTWFRWLAPGHTGVASATDSLYYHGPGRGAAYSVQSLLDGYHLTGQQQFMEMAAQLIRRCIHPADDLQDRNLLDVEPRWSYTVFLQMLGRYLDYKRELGEFDFMYAYARESLLAYARWMTRHEVPYLDRPEILEYPNETWAAQDMRKSEALKYAAAHSQGREREEFLERSRFFFEYSVSKLLASEGRSRTRPVVLMMVNGYMDAYFRRRVPHYALAATIEDFGTPTSFVAQKVRAKRRAAAALIVGMLTLGGTLAAAGWWWRLTR